MTMTRRTLLTGLATAALAAATLTAEVPAPAPPLAAIELTNRRAQAVPTRQGCVHTGAGNIDVQQPTPDVVIVTMTGVAVATAHPCKDSLAALAFDLCQDFDVVLAKPEVRRAKLTVEGRL